MSRLIEKSFNTGPNRGKVNLLVDELSNSLILSGAERSVAAAEVVVRQLDTNNRQQPLELRILELRAGEAAKGRAAGGGTVHRPDEGSAREQL